MLYPSIDELLDKVDSKYSLVVAVSKRSRMINDGLKSHLENPVSHKFVGIALEELYLGYIHYERSAKALEE